MVYYSDSPTRADVSVSSIGAKSVLFDMLGEVQHLGSARFAGAEASLLWYKDMFDNGRQAVQ